MKTDIITILRRKLYCFLFLKRLHPTDPAFELHFSKKNKYLSCLISKNGCSSILSSILKYDFHEEIDETKKIWDQKDSWVKHKDEHKILFNHNEKIDLTSFADYRKFVVLRHPLDRFISFINNTYKEKEYDYLFDKSLSPEKYVDSVLDFYPYMIDYKRKDMRFDKHAIPQRVYYEKYKEIFGNDLEIVMLKDLSEFFEKLTGVSLIKNNITKDSEKICAKETLTKNQQEKINEFLAEYEFYKDDEYAQLFSFSS